MLWFWFCFEYGPYVPVHPTPPHWPYRLWADPVLLVAEVEAAALVVVVVGVVGVWVAVVDLAEDRVVGFVVAVEGHFWEWREVC